MDNVFEQPVIVRWSDLDPNGHVRHSVYYDYAAQARVAFLMHQGVGIDWLGQRGIGPVLFREEGNFYRELSSGDQLIIDVRLSGLSTDHRKWSMHHRILRADELCATIDVSGAWLDLKARRIVPPPQEFSKKFEDLAHTENFRVITSGHAE